MKALPGAVLRSILVSALISFTLLGCAAPRATEPNPERARFETVVDDTYRIRYAFPTDHAGFSPKPKGSVFTEPKKAILLAGFGYPSGWFDRVVFSKSFDVKVERAGYAIPDGVTYEHFASAARTYSAAERESAKALKGAVFQYERGAERRFDVNGTWWACVDVVQTKLAPKVNFVNCHRPIDRTLIIGIGLLFAKPVTTDSDDYFEAMEKVKALAGTISWERR